MEVENKGGEVQVKLVLHVGNRQEEVVNNSETDKNKFSLKNSHHHHYHLQVRRFQSKAPLLLDTIDSKVRQLFPALAKHEVHPQCYNTLCAFAAVFNLIVIVHMFSSVKKESSISVDVF